MLALPTPIGFDPRDKAFRRAFRGIPRAAQGRNDYIFAMSGNLDDFIELDRTFRDLAISDEDGDEAKMVRLFAREASTRWADLLVEPRVIVLAEAGSGKTPRRSGIFAVAYAPRASRPSSCASSMSSTISRPASRKGTSRSSRPGSHSSDQGWLFLNSVDEARLRDPKDFERAIRRIGKRIERALQRAHIVITGRTEAWRPATDLLLCRTNLRWDAPAKAPDEAPAPQGKYAVAAERAAKRENRHAPFRIVTLEDLHGAQVETFAVAKGVTDIKAFTKAVERAEAWSFTTRPLDLAETVEFWNNHQRIGSRHDLMTSSVGKSLEERDQDRADARPIAINRIREGARLVAAATTLCQESAIRVPDGDQNSKGLPIKGVLTDWNDQGLRDPALQADFRPRHLRNGAVPPSLGARISDRRMAARAANRRRLAREDRRAVLPQAIRHRGDRADDAAGASLAGGARSADPREGSGARAGGAIRGRRPREAAVRYTASHPAADL